MANEDDSVKSSSFAIFIIHISYSGNKTQTCFLAEINLRPPESASFTYYVSGTKSS